MSQPDDARGKSGTSILLVDDDEIVRALTLAVLEDEGYTILEASSGSEAYSICEKIAPSLIIADAMMPNMDGFELCRMLRRNPLTQHVPILMATGLDDVASIAKAYDAGATDFITKPLNLPVLCYRVRFMLQEARTGGGPKPASSGSGAE